jgi:DNA-binding transcriptional LysR family regulator
MPPDISPRHDTEELLDLNDLRVFAYVASLASFSLAAQALNVHKSSVSRSIARLEALIGAALIERTTRKVALTQRGLQLHDRCLEILTRINETIASMMSLNASAARRVRGMPQQGFVRHP